MKGIKGVKTGERERLQLWEIYIFSKEGVRDGDFQSIQKLSMKMNYPKAQEPRCQYQTYTEKQAE